MAHDKSTAQDLDIFWLRRVYPDAATLFSFQPRPLDEVIEHCLVAVDTNVLLVPYGVGKDSIERIRKTYADLASAERLIIPGHVAREFVKNRTDKLKNLFQELWRKRTPNINTRNYPLLESSAEYATVIAAEKELLERWTLYQQQLDKALDRVRGWYWNDPVSQIYHEIFTSDVVLDPQFQPEEILADLEWRQSNKIPPGYKDAPKEDRGIGDLLIWRTILEAARTRKQDLVFVSNDKKTDWRYQSEGEELYPRFELVDEYRRGSDGHSFHIIAFSDMLGFLGASEKVVNEVRHEEELARVPLGAGALTSGVVEDLLDKLPTYGPASAPTVVRAGELLFSSSESCSMHLEGSSFSIETRGIELGNVSGLASSPFRPGDLVSPDAYFFDELGWGPAAVSGSRYDRLSFGGALRCSGPGVPLPSKPPSIFRVPFTFAAALHGHQHHAFIDPFENALVNLRLVGRGVASFELNVQQDPHLGTLANCHRIRYRFEPVSG